MDEEYWDIDPEEGLEDPSEEDQQIAPDAFPVCPHCLNECDPRDYYCPHCGSNDPINPLASYMPLPRLRFETGLIGKTFHQIVGPGVSIPTRLISFVLALWYAPLILLFGIPTLLRRKLGRKNRWIPILVGIYYIGLILAIAWFLGAFSTPNNPASFPIPHSQ